MSLVLASVLVVVLVCLVKFALDIKELYRKLSGYVRPPGNFLIGHTLNLGSTTTIIQSLLKYQQEYGDLIRIDVGFCYPFILITDLKFLEGMLTSNKFLEKSADYRFFHKWLGTGLLTSSGSKWFTRRKLITPAFHFQILEQFIDVFNACSDILIEKLSLENGEQVNVAALLTLYSLDVTCETSLGTSIGALSNEHSEYVKSIREVTRIFALRGFSFLKQLDCFYFFTSDYWNEKKAIEVIHKYTWDVIRRRRKEKNENSGASNASGENEFGIKRRKAFLDLLLDAKLDGKSLEDDEIREEVDTIMFAGQDTSSTAMAFTLFCLAKHPEIQDEIVKELHKIFEDDKHRPVKFSDLHEMKYMEMCIKESMRLYPPVAIFARQVLQDEELDGKIIPPDVPLVAFPFGLHRNPEIYPDPEKFDPQRFTTENQAKRHHFAYIPFSAGTRNCLGQKFAMLLMKTTLANLLRKFKIIPVPGHELELCYQTVLRSNNGVPLKFQQRSF